MDIYNLIQSKLVAYLGSPLIQLLEPEETAVSSAFYQGLSDYWITCPYEVPRAISVAQGDNKLSIKSLQDQDISVESGLSEFVYPIGLTYVQFNPMPMNSINNSSMLNNMMLGTYSRNIYSSSFSYNNVIRGYNSSRNNPFQNTITTDRATSIDNQTVSIMMSNYSGTSGTVKYRFDTVNKQIVINVPVSAGGILEFSVGYGFLPNDPSDKTQLDQVLSAVDPSHLPLITDYIASRFLTLLIAARGNCTFSGADYTLDTNILSSKLSEVNKRLEEEAANYSYIVLSLQ